MILRALSYDFEPYRITLILTTYLHRYRVPRLNSLITIPPRCAGKSCVGGMPVTLPTITKVNRNQEA